MKKILASDMDGTFLASDHTFDKVAFRKLLDDCKEKGYLFVAASGRPLLSLEKVFAGFENDMAFVAENGSIVSYQGQILFEDEPIPQETYLEIVDAIEEGPYGNQGLTVLSARTGAYMLTESHPEYFDLISQFYVNTQRVDSFSQVTENIIKMVAAFPDEKMAEAQAWLNQKFPQVVAVTTGGDSVDIILSGVNKAIGLQKLCDYFDVTAADIVAFGDNQNDLEMLDFAGLAIATENARQEVKDRVDQVIGHCNDGAVLKFMEEYVNKGNRLKSLK
ncbi:Cof-type HAD-IIB family hydrolase [Streptococcus gallinaceus]|uniref:Cof subfamily protein (Haloacid dehalogenase superfamily) n=1 Tax=Streptococcus gallinaceus TaxID=165758 RepID=A0ABV2JK00_9STRE